MKKNKIFIIGGRSGTSLMLRLLGSYGLKGWSKNSIREPKITRTKIRETYPNVPISIFDDYQEDFQVVKLPHFDFIIDLIIKKYDNPIFIVMDRNIKDIVASYQGTRFSKMEWANREMELSPGTKKAMIDFNGREPKNDLEAYVFWLKLTRHLREKHLKNYKNIFRIDFSVFMNEFHLTMAQLCAFLKLKPKPRVFQRLRTRKWSPSAKGINYYLK